MKSEDIIKILLPIEEKTPLPFSVEVLNLSPRVLRTLLRNKVNTVGDLVRYWRVIPNFTNMGGKGIQQISDNLEYWYQQEEKLLLSSVSGFSLSSIEEEQVEVEKLPFVRDDTLSNIPVAKLDLPIRVYNVLNRNNIKTVGQIYSQWKNINSIKYVGVDTLDQIQNAIVALQNQVSDQKSKANLVKVRIRALALSASAERLLRTNNIETIDQITSEKLKRINSAEDTNPHAVRQIFTAVLDWLNEDEDRKNAYLKFMQGEGIIASPEQISFDDYFTLLFGLLNPRYYPVIEFRHGLRTGKKTTLEETAKQFGVTRERIRQIESMAIDQVKQQLSRIDSPWLFQKIREKIEARGGLISQFRLVDELRYIFTNTVYSVDGILEFLNKVFDGELSTDHDEVKIVYMLTLSGWSTSSYDKEQILLAANKIIATLSAAELPMQWEDIFSTLIIEDGLLTLDEHLAHAVALCLSDNQQIQRQLDGGWKKNEKTTRYSRIITVMRQIGRPAHFSEIAELYNQTYPDIPQSAHHVHTVLSGRREFVRVGQGKYGLPEWGLHDDGNVSNAVLRILANHKRPMSLADITNEVLKTWDVQNSAVISAIDGDARFSKTEDGKIWLTETGLTVKKRIKRDDDARWDRLLIVLREIGKPSPVNLIVETHNDSHPERPLTVSAVKSMMFRKPDLYAYLGHNEFGLVEWGLKSSIPTSSTDRKKEILDIIKEQGPIRFDDLHDLHNHRYSDQPISKNTLQMYLSKLRDVISKPNRGEYHLAGQPGVGHQISISSGRNTQYSQKLVEVLKEIGQPAHIDDIVVVYKRLFPNDNKEYANIRVALYNNRKTLVNFGSGIFGLSGWEAPQNISSRPRDKKNENAPSSTRRVGKFERVLNIFTEIDHPLRTALILERYNQVHSEDPIQLNDLYRVFNAHKESFVKVSTGVYGLSTWNVDAFEAASPYSRRERLIATLQTIGVPSKINEIMGKHNELYPKQPLSYATVNELLFKNKDVFISVGRGTYSFIASFEDQQSAS